MQSRPCGISARWYRLIFALGAGDFDLFLKSWMIRPHYVK